MGALAVVVEYLIQINLLSEFKLDVQKRKMCQNIYKEKQFKGEYWRIYQKN